MAAPEKPVLDYSYTAFQQAQGDNSFPGTQLDNDLANLKRAVDATIDFTGGVIRNDGKLGNGVVGRNSLDESLTLGINAPRPWTTDTTYEADDSVSIANSLYICLIGHFSDIFTDDLAAGYWSKLVEFTVPLSVPADAVGTPAIQDAAVTGPKIAGGAVTKDKVPDGELPRVKLAQDVATIPVGASLDWDGVFAPPGFLLKYGQLVSRTTYAATMAALTGIVTAAATTSSATLSVVNVDLTKAGLEGAPIEGEGLPIGTTIQSVTASTIVLSAAATSTGSGRSFRVFPHGNGDGSTTFRIPDDRDVVTVGRGNMGGAARGLITASGDGNPGLNTSRLGAAGGVDRMALGIDQIPGHGHSVTITHPPHQVPLTGGGVGAGGGPGQASAPYNGALVDSVPPGDTTATTNSVGGGKPHPNLPPSRVVNRIIYTGVFS